MDGYELLHVAMRLQLGPRMTARLRLQNLLDEDYQTQLGFPGVGLSVLGGFRIEL